MNFKNIINKFLKNSTITNLVLVGVLTIIVKGLGFFKEMVIADSFGLSELLDTFYIAFLIPSFIHHVFLDAFKSVFIPNYVNELHTFKKIGSFQSASFLVTIGSSIFFILIAILFTDVYLEAFFDGHTEIYYSLIKKQFYFVVPCILFWGFSSLINGLLTIDNEFTFSSINTIFTPISIIICIVFFKDELGAIVLAFGTLAGSILNFIFLITVALNRKIIVLSKPDFKSDNIIILFKQIPAKLTAGLLVGVNPIVDQYFAAQLIAGSIAALNFGIKIPAFTIGIIAIAISNVLLPYFSKKAVEDKMKAFQNLKRMLKNIIVLSAIAVIILIIMSHPIVTLLFERNAFTSTDTTKVALIQQMYLIQIPFYVSALIMVKFLISINKNTFMAFASFISLVLNFILNFILMGLMDVFGLALSTSLVALVNSVVLYAYILHIKKNDFI